jgi:hypothetical protein
MPGLVPGIHAVVRLAMKERSVPSGFLQNMQQRHRVDGRDKPGHDG